MLTHMLGGGAKKHMPKTKSFGLFAMYWNFGLLSTVRYDLADLDGTTMGTFTPASYSLFSDAVIRDGTNIHFKTGFDVFTISKLSSFFENEVMPQVTAASKVHIEMEQAIAACAARVFPYRIPRHLFSRRSMSA